MQSASPMQLAQEFTRSLDVISEDEQSNTGFAALRKLCQKLEDTRKDREEDPLTAAASKSVSDLISNALEDVTRAVPWDDPKRIEAARKEVLSLSNEAVNYLSKYDTDDKSKLGYFEKIGELLLRYESILDSLNEDDRRLLLRIREGARDD